MPVAPKKAVKSAAPKKAAGSNNSRPLDAVDVKNISDKRINTSQGCIQPGEQGKATNDELRRWNKILEKA